MCVTNLQSVCVCLCVGVVAKTFQDGPLVARRPPPPPPHPPTLGFLCADPPTSPPTSPSIPEGPPLHSPHTPSASSCQVYGSKVTMRQPACENIELQKHPWVRGCVNGAFSAGTDPGPVLLTDGQQMAFCVRRGAGEAEGKEEERLWLGEILIFFFLENSSLWGPECRSEMPYHTTCLTFALLTQ